MVSCPTWSKILGQTLATNSQQNKSKKFVQIKKKYHSESQNYENNGDKTNSFWNEENPKLSSKILLLNI